MNSYKELVVWQKSIELVKETYGLVKLLPKEETYALSDQMRRAVVSIPSNIAEGFARKYTKEFVNFISIALGSNAELETQLTICMELKYIRHDDAIIAFGLIEEIRKMLIVMRNNLIKNH